MHRRLLSNLEREILEDFVKTGNKRDGFRLLKSLIKQNYTQIQEDFELIETAYKKFQEA